MSHEGRPNKGPGPCKTALQLACSAALGLSHWMSDLAYYMLAACMRLSI